MRATKLRVGWRLTVTLTEAVSTAHGLLLAGAEPLGAPLLSDAAIDWRPGVLMSLLPESWQVGSTWARGWQGDLATWRHFGGFRHPRGTLRHDRSHCALGRA